jgi:hypothetical protein
LKWKFHRNVFQVVVACVEDLNRIFPFSPFAGEDNAFTTVEVFGSETNFIFCNSGMVSLKNEFSTKTTRFRTNVD